MIVMSNLPFKKFKRQINERRSIGLEGEKLSPKLRSALNDVYAIVNNTKGSVISKIDGIIKKVAKKHGVKVNDIEDYFDNELIK